MGEITREKMISAYQKGIFPMAIEHEDYRIEWCRPLVRCVIPINRFHVSHSLRRTIRKGIFNISVDQEFDSVIRNCAAPRPESPGCWLSEELIEAYTELFRCGFAHSVEIWHEGRLAGGLFGVSTRGLFAGESMFHRVTDASKVALWATNEIVKRGGYRLFDVQMWTQHLSRFGAEEISRHEYLNRLHHALEVDGVFQLPQDLSI